MLMEDHPPAPAGEGPHPPGVPLSGPGSEPHWWRRDDPREVLGRGSWRLVVWAPAWKTEVFVAWVDKVEPGQDFPEVELPDPIRPHNDSEPGWLGDHEPWPKGWTWTLPPELA